MLDLLFRQACVFDGSGAEPEITDVGVSDGRIAFIGAAGNRAARRSIDAEGLALMPGIIDSHTHFDAQITWTHACGRHRRWA